VVERRGSIIVAHTLARNANPQCNGESITHPRTLKDRDSVTVERYQVLYLEGQSAPAQSETGASAKAATGFAALSGFGEGSAGAGAEPSTDRRAPQNTPFGRTDLMSDHNGNEEYSQPPPSFDAVEDRVIVLVAGVLILALIVLIFLWVLL
jgi:hypothetical protein